MNDIQQHFFDKYMEKARQKTKIISQRDAGWWKKSGRTGRSFFGAANPATSFAESFCPDR